MLEGFQLDPYTILGLARGASPGEVREAFREKSKKHHPDHGGDEWAFRIVVRAYEILSTGRDGEDGLAVDRGAARPAPPRAPFVPAADAGQIRPGLHDRGVDPSRIVAIEIVWMRYEVEDVTELLSLSQADRNLSGTLHILWPDPEAKTAPPAADIPKILKDLAATFENLKSKTKADASIADTPDDARFEAWLSYPSGSVAWDAFKVLHVGLKLRKLGVRQWTRDMTVPRPS